MLPQPSQSTPLLDMNQHLLRYKILLPCDLGLCSRIPAHPAPRWQTLCLLSTDKHPGRPRLAGPGRTTSSQSEARATGHLLSICGSPKTKDHICRPWPSCVGCVQPWLKPSHPVLSPAHPHSPQTGN
ncbi:hypothetical protein NP493_342g00021 [Ridgeia piscesae]|uniref:Uncharacterized protein n=1 Tax=Ridgeia piscesae TaxID=27915 RepID=A0AAD9L556_RIDPI|nr:hypothetical protein NP493_342g00021 [Ridgeia piscesae]